MLVRMNWSVYANDTFRKDPVRVVQEVFAWPLGKIHKIEY